jgi:hypothetical protein
VQFPRSRSARIERRPAPVIKLTCERDVLAEKLALVSRAVSSRTAVHEGLVGGSYAWSTARAWGFHDCMEPEMPGTYTEAIVKSLRAGVPVVIAIGNEGAQTSGSPGNDIEVAVPSSKVSVTLSGEGGRWRATAGEPKTPDDAADEAATLDRAKDFLVGLLHEEPVFLSAANAFSAAVPASDLAATAGSPLIKAVHVNRLRPSPRHSERR